ncbi:adenylyltransferase/cytidyltransferase family protein [Simkania sp.]|uniref:adenylyltransferase/cytidyltransferase family protein n=1 Tax=Simkania sp. TaxID=34094 RepID=UPI003B522C16
MKVVTKLEDIPPAVTPIALTIGIFDGIHLGHQAIIKELHKLTRKTGTRVLLTFSNHPSQIFQPEAPTPLVMSFQHRLHLLKLYGIDLVIALPFTREFSQQSYIECMEALRKKLPFQELVLGEDASFGKNREGDEEHMKALADQMGFKTHYLKKERHHKETISSGMIRNFIQEGKLKKIKKYLGRPYSIWKPLDPDAIKKENETLYSWSFETSELSSLPSGVYGVDFEGEPDTLPAIAFIQNAQDLSGPLSTVTVYLESEPPNTPSVNLSFVEYLHPEIDPTLFQSTPASILEDLSAQPSLS